MPAINAPPKEQKFTTWYNPTDKEVRLELYVGDPSRDNPTGRNLYVVPAKGHKDIPSSLDMGVQHEVEGVIVGGLGPMLRREGGAATLHPSIDPAETEKKEALRAAESAIAQKKAAEDAMLLAGGKLAAAEAKENAKAAAAVPPPPKPKVTREE